MSNVDTLNPTLRKGILPNGKELHVTETEFCTPLIIPVSCSVKLKQYSAGFINTGNNREYRVPGFLYSRPNWVPPHPNPQASEPPPLDPRRKTPLACEGVEDTIQTISQKLWCSVISVQAIQADVLVMFNEIQISRHCFLEIKRTYTVHSLGYSPLPVDCFSNKMYST